MTLKDFLGFTTSLQVAMLHNFILQQMWLMAKLKKRFRQPENAESNHFAVVLFSPSQTNINSLEVLGPWRIITQVICYYG